MKTQGKGKYGEIKEEKEGIRKIKKKKDDINLCLSWLRVTTTLRAERRSPCAPRAALRVRT